MQKDGIVVELASADVVDVGQNFSFWNSIAWSRHSHADACRQSCCLLTLLQPQAVHWYSWCLWPIW